MGDKPPKKPQPPAELNRRKHRIHRRLSITSDTRGSLLSNSEMKSLDQFIQNHQKEIAAGHITMIPKNSDNKDFPKLSCSVIFVEQSNKKKCYILYDKNELSTLGKGAYSDKVLIGQNKENATFVAVKIKGFNRFDVKHQMFDQEIEILKEIKQFEASAKFLSHDWIEGHIMTPLFQESLHTYLYPSNKPEEQIGKIESFEEKLDIAIKLFTELKTNFHDKDILHRDLKDSNIMYDRQSGQVNIIDVGESVDLRVLRIKEAANFRKVKQQQRTIEFYKDEGVPGDKFYHSAEIKERSEYSKESDIAAAGKICAKLFETDKKKSKESKESKEIDALLKRMNDPDPFKRPTAEEAISILVFLKRKYFYSQELKSIQLQQPALGSNLKTFSDQLKVTLMNFPKTGLFSMSKKSPAVLTLEKLQEMLINNIYQLSELPIFLHNSEKILIELLEDLKKHHLKDNSYKAVIANLTELIGVTQQLKNTVTPPKDPKQVMH